MPEPKTSIHHFFQVMRTSMPKFRHMWMPSVPSANFCCFHAEPHDGDSSATPQIDDPTVAANVVRKIMLDYTINLIWWYWLSQNTINTLLMLDHTPNHFIVSRRQNLWESIHGSPRPTVKVACERALRLKRRENGWSISWPNGALSTTSKKNHPRVVPPRGVGALPK